MVHTNFLENKIIRIYISLKIKKYIFSFSGKKRNEKVTTH